MDAAAIFAAGFALPKRELPALSLSPHMLDRLADAEDLEGGWGLCRAGTVSSEGATSSPTGKRRTADGFLFSGISPLGAWIPGKRYGEEVRGRGGEKRRGEEKPRSRGA